MNNVILIGRTTREPELRYTAGGVAFARFTLAIDKKLSKEKKQEMESENKPTADFINIVCWRHTAEFVANHLGKGKKAAVRGGLQSGKYEKDGQTVFTTDVVAEDVEVLEWMNDNNQQQKSGGDFSGLQDFHPIDNDDIPF